MFRLSVSELLYDLVSIAIEVRWYLRTSDVIRMILYHAM